MSVKIITLAIADIPLSIEYTGHNGIPHFFRRFKTNGKTPINQIWHLKSEGINGSHLPEIYKNRSSKASFQRIIRPKISRILPRPSFYFNDPVKIDIKRRKIQHFYLKENIQDGVNFDSRLITFAYSQILASKQGILLHAAGVVKEGKAYLFFAPANGGKSTVAQLSKKYQILGDDIIALRKIKRDFFAFSTPWKQGKFISSKPSSKVKIKAVFFLKKSNQLYFKPLRPEEALVRTLSKQIHFFLYTERPLVKKIFFSAADFFKTIPAYQMHFNQDNDFWPKLEMAIK